jgi:hypothetical protein
MYQQRTIDEYIAGQADNTQEWQEIDLADKYILKDTLAITINSVSWSILGTGSLSESFVFSGSTDKHIKLINNTDESAKIRFGNGTYGEIPGSYDIYATYAVGGGSDSNVSANTIIVYAGSNTNVEGVSNLSAMTGGADIESLASAKVLAPLLLKTRERFVTTEDGEALSQNYSGIALAKVNKNVYGLLSAQVVCIANGGGNPSGAVKTALQTYLINRTILESIDIRVEDATITSTAVTSAGKVTSGYNWTNVLPYFRLAWKLFLSEAGQEILDNYDDNGVESVTTLINTVFSESFDSTDYGQIIRFLDNFTPRSFGDTIQEADAFGFIDTFVIGLDYLTITLPSFPISLSDDEITTPGSFTLTEIT